MFDIVENTNQVTGAKIKVIGVGGGGCNAVNTMIRAGLTGVEYIVANTDSQALAASLAGVKIQLGSNITKGLGAGANPEVGRKAAIEDYEKLSEALDGADMVFVTAGMGGGTGTGAAPVIAKLSREMGALTVGVVTKPFMFEGKKRSRQAQEGIRCLEESVDSLICIPNQRLLQLAGENLSLVDTFRAADEVLLNAVQGISDLINNTGLINADFADVSTVMKDKGLSLMGTGTASGEQRSLEAARQAISSPLLEDVSINGATGIIINITGDQSLTTHETNQAVTHIMEAADDDAEIIFGTVIDESMEDSIKVTVIATGLQTARLEVNPSLGATNKVGPKEEMNASDSNSNHQNSRKNETKADHNIMNDQTFQSESNFNMESDSTEEIEQPRIKWAEKLQSAASRYENQKNFDNDLEAPSEISPPKSRQEFSHGENSISNNGGLNSQANQNRESRIKSIAEKLGFFNFDEDEFDTPSYMKKTDRGFDSQI